MKSILYNKVISQLKSEREKMLLKLTEGNKHSEILNYKIQLDNAIKCLGICEKYNILPNKIKNIIELPDLNTGFSEYRIMNDCETEDRKHWIELNIDNDNIRLVPNDIIIERKL